MKWIASNDGSPSFRRRMTVAAVSFSILAGAFAVVVEPHVYSLAGDFRGAHDPSAIREGKTWYVFTTGRAVGSGQIGIRCSTDLQNWKVCGHVFDELPQWIHETSPGTRDLWAPDVSFEHGEYRLYYAFSLFGRNISGIALATNKTLDQKSPSYKWIDQGLVLRSTRADDFNAIDPNFVRDRHGREWLAFGSFWTGIKMHELDQKTGKLAANNQTLYSLASRERSPSPETARPNLPPDSQAIEAPFIVHHGDYYYLFVSWDLCCRGKNSTYRTMVGRSRDITGPYVDNTGKPMTQGGGTPLLKGNHRWVGPGGASILPQHGRPDLIFFHAYDASAGWPALQISTLEWVDDWPEASLSDEQPPTTAR